MVEQALDFAIYSIKAVAHMAGITEPTLRAWEKRYSILNPDRTDSGHRRYTKRDIYRVMWLKMRLEEGMSISQAATLLQTQPETVLLEMAEYEKRSRLNGRQNGANTSSSTYSNGNSSGSISNSSYTEGRNSNAGSSRQNSPANHEEVRSPQMLTQSLLKAFLDFDEATAESLLSEAASIYPPETVCVDIIQAVLIEIGERWMNNEITVATEHFASTLCRSRLNAMIEALPLRQDGPLVLAACGPQEFHEMGIIITTYFLRRNGWRVIYLGQNVPALDLEKDLLKLRPSLIVFSSGRSESALLLAREVLPLIQRIQDIYLPNLIFAYAGRAFVNDPGLHELFHNQVYFGDDARQSLGLIDNLLTRSAS